MVMLHVFQSDTMPHTIESVAAATRQLNACVDDYLSDKPGLLVAGMGNLYFHLACFDGTSTFTMLLPVMFAMAEDTED
jgi:hypothetical protein